MPMPTARLDPINQTVTTAAMRNRLAADFDLAPEATADPADPARGWVCRRTGARVGFISSISHDFCDTCTRMRLTAEGSLRPCLHQDAELDLKAALRSGATDDRLAELYAQAADVKWRGHQMTQFVPLFSRREMVGIGG